MPSSTKIIPTFSVTNLYKYGTNLKIEHYLWKITYFKMHLLDQILFYTMKYKNGTFNLTLFLKQNSFKRFFTHKYFYLCSLNRH